MVITLIKKLTFNLNILTNFFKTTPTILFLRKARLFVKSRYSRNRQWSKSIVYFGLWFNIISVIWSLYYCYRYVFIFSHLYWLGFVFVFFIGLRLAKFIKFSTGYLFLKNFTFKC